MAETPSDFWAHLDELRRVILRILLAAVAAMLLAFCFKESLFSIVLAPQHSDFLLYRFLDFMAHQWGLSGIPSFQSVLISTQLTAQFLIHMKVAACAGVVLVSPYILYQLFRFVSPALYEQEKKYAFRIISSAYILFVLGVLLSYFVVFPLSFRFLGSYQVSPEVANTITISSYIDTLVTLSLLMGLMFEIPILCWSFARLGFLHPDFMRKYRKHAIILIVALTAIITPTGDVFTLMIVSLPILCWYELSIFVVAKVEKSRNLSKQSE